MVFLSSFLLSIWLLKTQRFLKCLVFWKVKYKLQMAAWNSGQSRGIVVWEWEAGLLAWVLVLIHHEFHLLKTKRQASLVLPSQVWETAKWTSEHPSHIVQIQTRTAGVVTKAGRVGSPCLWHQLPNVNNALCKMWRMAPGLSILNRSQGFSFQCKMGFLKC